MVVHVTAVLEIAEPGVIAASGSVEQPSMTTNVNSGADIPVYPDTAPFAGVENMGELLRLTARQYGDQTAFLWLDESGHVQRMSYREFYENAQHLALGLQEFGVARGSMIGLFTTGGPRSEIAYQGVYSSGAVAIGYYNDFEPDELVRDLKRGEPEVIIVSDADHVRKVLRAEEKLDKRFRLIVVLEGLKQKPTDLRIISADEIIRRGDAVFRSEPERFDEMLRGIRKTDPVHITFSSGTTGGSGKGVVHTHGSFVNSARMIGNSHSRTEMKMPEMGCYLAVGPPAHASIRQSLLFAWISGWSVAFPRDASDEAILEAFGVFKPDAVFMHPDFVNATIKHAYEQATAKAGGFGKEIVKTALWIGNEYRRAREKGKRLSWVKRAVFRAMDKGVFRKIKDAFGGNLKALFLGSAPIDPLGLGILGDIPTYINYGSSEAGAITNETPRRRQFGQGSVGVPAGPAVRVRVIPRQSGDPTGEVEVWTPALFSHYLNDSAGTAAIRTSDGWYRTGDLGYFDRLGRLHLVGRIKNVISDQAGNKIDPDFIAKQLEQIQGVRHAAAFGSDQHDGLVAVLSIDPDKIPAFLRVGRDKTGANLQGLVADGVAEYNASVEFSFRQIREFAVTTDSWEQATAADGTRLVGPTRKIRRDAVRKVYERRIEEMLSSVARDAGQEAVRLKHSKSLLARLLGTTAVIDDDARPSQEVPVSLSSDRPVIRICRTLLTKLR